MQLTTMEEALYSCCRLLVEGTHDSWVASGFFVKVKAIDGRQSDLLFTCKHVIDDAEKISISVRRNVGDDPIRKPVLAKIDMRISDSAIIFHPTEDLCGIFVHPYMMNIGEADGRWPLIFCYGLDDICRSKDLDALEEFIMIGSPSGIYDEVNNHAIIRRGVTASHPAFKYKGHQQFLVDCASHSGSSGSPIIRYGNMFYDRERQTYDLALHPRLGLLGMLSSGFDEDGDAKQHIDLGVAVSSDAIIELMEDAKAFLG